MCKNVVTWSLKTMPGLPTRPCFYEIDLDSTTGDIHGVF